MINGLYLDQFFSRYESLQAFAQLPENVEVQAFESERDEHGRLDDDDFQVNGSRC